MILTILVIIFVVSFSIYVLLNSYSFQVFIRTNLRLKEIVKLKNETKGSFLKSAYYSSKYQITTKDEFKTLLKRQKVELHKCYLVLTFKTIDANWELFFTLTKESGKFNENIYLKCYPTNTKINSKVAIEKIHSKLEIFSSNYSLMQILNENSTMTTLNSLLTNHQETLNIGQRYIQFKGELLFENISKTKILHKISHINELKNKIYVDKLKGY